MRHRVSRLRLRHKPAHSRSMIRNIVTSVLLYETVRTTKKRAQVVRPLVERIITAAKTKEPQVAIRYINAIVTHTNASKKTMEVLKARYADHKTGGYTRMEALGSRAGDGAELVNLSLVEGKDVVVPEKAPKVKKPKAAKKASSSTTQK